MDSGTRGDSHSEPRPRAGHPRALSCFPICNSQGIATLSPGTVQQCVIQVLARCKHSLIRKGPLTPATHVCADRLPPTALPEEGHQRHRRPDNLEGRLRRRAAPTYFPAFRQLSPHRRESNTPSWSLVIGRLDPDVHQGMPGHSTGFGQCCVSGWISHSRSPPGAQGPLGHTVAMCLHTGHECPWATAFSTTRPPAGLSHTPDSSSGQCTSSLGLPGGPSSEALVLLCNLLLLGNKSVFSQTAGTYGVVINVAASSSNFSCKCL